MIFKRVVVFACEIINVFLDYFVTQRGSFVNWRSYTTVVANRKGNMQSQRSSFAIVRTLRESIGQKRCCGGCVALNNLLWERVIGLTNEKILIRESYQRDCFINEDSNLKAFCLQSRDNIRLVVGCAKMKAIIANE